MNRRLAPLTEHLAELRKRIARYLFVLTIAVVVGFYGVPPVVSFFQPPEGTLIILGPLDAFLVRFSLALLTGFLISFPYLLFELFGFVRPALLPEEQGVAFWTGTAALLLFGAGVTLAYFLLPTSLRFLLGFAGTEFQTMLAADRYFGFIFWFFLVFGISFELPLVLLFLVRVGILSVRDLRHSRRFAILAIIVLAALLTPTQDIFTLLVLSGPLYVLYEGTLLLASFKMPSQDKAAVPLQKE